jgi:putative transposase
VKFAFIHAEKARWPIEVQCDVFEVSRSGYYAWAARLASPRAVEDAALIVEIKAAHRTGRGAYGSPRVHRELRAKGRRIGKKRVERLMREEGIAARKKRRFRRTTDSNHPHPIAPNVLERDFHVELPNTAWVTDVTYVWTWRVGSTSLRFSTCSLDAWSAGQPARTTTAPSPSAPSTKLSRRERPLPA